MHRRKAAVFFLFVALLALFGVLWLAFGGSAGCACQPDPDPRSASAKASASPSATTPAMPPEIQGIADKLPFDPSSIIGAIGSLAEDDSPDEDTE